MLIRSIFLTTLETTISRFIALDSEAPRLLKPIQGKVIAIHIESLDWTFYLCPSDSSIQLLEHYEGSPDTTLSGSPFGFANIGLSTTPSDVLFSGQIKIEGDASTGRNFQTLFKRLEIDWEEQLSHVTGDILAHQIGNFVRAARQWGQDSKETLRLNVGEYLQEESRDLPTSYECNDLFEQIDSIRADTDRLEMRLKRISSTAPETK